MIKWKDYKKGKGLFAKHLADSKLACSCNNKMLFIVQATEDGDIYCICPKCWNEETISYN